MIKKHSAQTTSSAAPGFLRLAAANHPMDVDSRVFNLKQSGNASARYFSDIYITGVMMNRNFKAPLSPSELASLRGLKMNEKRQIPASHRQLLLSMGLIVVAGDDLIITETGSQRLDHGDGAKSYREEPMRKTESERQWLS
jgi:hypothetical protein